MAGGGSNYHICHPYALIEKGREIMLSCNRTRKGEKHLSAAIRRSLGVFEHTQFGFGRVASASKMRATCQVLVSTPLPNLHFLGGGDIHQT